MKSIVLNGVVPVLGAVFVAGCAAPRPETLALMERDKAIYQDEGGALQQKKERKDKVAVVVSQGNYTQYKEAAEAIDSQLTESLSSFAFFQVVERSNLGAIQQEKLFAGDDDINDVVVPADYMITAKMNSVKVEQYVAAQNEMIPGLNSGPGPKSRVSLSVDFRFYEVATKRVILTKNISKEYSGLEPSTAMSKLALAGQECVKGFAHTIGSRFAPPARVIQTRGNCEVARISIGANYGLVPGVEVEFYEFIDNSAIIAGATRDKNVIGKGRVLEVDKTSAWVEVFDYEKVHVMRGHYVGIIEDQSNRMRFQDVLRMDSLSL